MQVLDTLSLLCERCTPNPTDEQLQAIIVIAMRFDIEPERLADRYYV